jgi:hypothetical protein
VIYLSAALTWPVKHDPKFYENYFWKTWKLTKNKSLEIQVDKGSNELIGFMFRLSFKQDHAGLMIDLSLFYRTIYFQIYDNRHWDHDKGCYETYEENTNG